MQIASEIGRRSGGARTEERRRDLDRGGGGGTWSGCGGGGVARSGRGRLEAEAEASRALGGAPPGPTRWGALAPGKMRG